MYTGFVKAVFFPTASENIILCSNKNTCSSLPRPALVLAGPPPSQHVINPCNKSLPCAVILPCNN